MCIAEQGVRSASSSPCSALCSSAPNLPRQLALDCSDRDKALCDATCIWSSKHADGSIGLVHSRQLRVSRHVKRTRRAYCRK